MDSDWNYVQLYQKPPKLPAVDITKYGNFIKYIVLADSGGERRFAEHPSPACDVTDWLYHKPINA